MPWCLVAIATATADAFARELVSLELRFHSTLASVLQPARSPRRMRTQEYFANVREPLGFFQLSRVVTQARHRGGHRENIFFNVKRPLMGRSVWHSEALRRARATAKPTICQSMRLYPLKYCRQLMRKNRASSPLVYRSFSTMTTVRLAV